MFNFSAFITLIKMMRERKRINGMKKKQTRNKNVTTKVKYNCKYIYIYLKSEYRRGEEKRTKKII